MNHKTLIFTPNYTYQQLMEQIQREREKYIKENYEEPEYIILPKDVYEFFIRYIKENYVQNKPELETIMNMKVVK